MLQPELGPVLPRWKLLLQAEGARRRPGLHSVQEQQLDAGQGAQVAGVAAHRQRRQAGGQICKHHT